ncbi:hypothetical protein GS944_01440 [Rhodococcus hoagii]|nr:hypothetical protein [Prescottella equi]
MPSRACRPHLLARLRERPTAGLKFNEMVASGELSAPIAIGRDHLDSAPSPRRTARRGMKDGRTRSPSRCLKRPRHTASGASGCRSTRGGVGMGRSIHAGQGASPTAPSWPRRRSRPCSPTTRAGRHRHVDGATSTRSTPRASVRAYPDEREQLTGTSDLDPLIHHGTDHDDQREPVPVALTSAR